MHRFPVMDDSIKQLVGVHKKAIPAVGQCDCLHRRRPVPSFRLSSTSPSSLWPSARQSPAAADITNRLRPKMNSLGGAFLQAAQDLRIGVEVAMRCTSTPSSATSADLSKWVPSADRR